MASPAQHGNPPSSQGLLGKLSWVILRVIPWNRVSTDWKTDLLFPVFHFTLTARKLQLTLRTHFWSRVSRATFMCPPQPPLVYLFFSETESIQSWLVWNSVCRPGCLEPPETHLPVCLSVGIKGTGFHSWLLTHLWRLYLLHMMLAFTVFWHMCTTHTVLFTSHNLPFLPPLPRLLSLRQGPPSPSKSFFQSLYSEYERKCGRVIFLHLASHDGHNSFITYPANDIFSFFLMSQ